MSRENKRGGGASPGEPGDTKGLTLESDIPASDHTGPILVEDLAEINPDELDPVAAAWSLPGEDFRVELFRTKPTNFRGQDITGYCDDVAVEDTFSSIKQRFGGGTYRLIRRDIKSGKMLWARTFKIAGNPVLSPNPDDPRSPELVPTKKLESPVATIDLGGVNLPLTGDMAELQKMILFVKAVKTVFPDPPDYNSQLLGLLLEQKKTDDPLDLLVKLRSAVPEVFAGGGDDSGGGANLYSLLQEAIKQAGGILSGVSALQSRPAVRPMTPARPPVPALPVSSHVSKPTQPEPVTAAPESEESLSNPSPQQIALGAVAEIVKAFTVQGGPQPVEEVVQGLDLATGILPTDRYKIAPFKGALRSMAARSLPDYLGDELLTQDTHSQFLVYFDQVFDSFVNPDRAGL